MRINKAYVTVGVMLSFFLIIGLAIILGKKNAQVSLNNQPPTQFASNNNTQSIASVGNPAPDFTLTGIDGKQYNLQDLRGKTVILFGMAGWCGECIPEGQALSQIQQNYGDKVQAIGVAFTQGDNKTLLEQYKQTGKVTIPLAVDTDNVGQKYNLTQLDTTYIINRQGVVVYKSEQSMSYQELEQQLQNVL